MSRHSVEFQAVEGQVVDLLRAMELGHAQQRQAGSSFVGRLSKAVGCTSESLRVDFAKYRVGRGKRGGRVPSSDRVVRLVDAATGLGWMESSAIGSGAEELVECCRREVQKVRSSAVEKNKRRQAAQRAQKMTEAERYVDASLGRLAGAVLTQSATEMLAVVVRRIQHHLLRSEAAQQPSGDFLHDDVVQANADIALTGMLATLSDEVPRWQGLQRRNEEGLVAAMEFERELVESRFAANRAALKEDALVTLGIGPEQLERILKCLHSGDGLTPDDAKQREKLLALYGGFRRAARLSAGSRSRPLQADGQGAPAAR